MGVWKKTMEVETVNSSPEPNRTPCSSRNTRTRADLEDKPHGVHSPGVAASPQPSDTWRKIMNSFDYPLPDETMMVGGNPDTRPCLDDRLAEEEPHVKATASRPVLPDPVLEEEDSKQQKKKKKVQRRREPQLMKILFLRCNAKIQNQADEIAELKK